MKVRTVYFKVDRLDEVSAFWRAFLGSEPTKVFPEWHEFRVGDLNLGLLKLLSPEARGERGRCVPVFECADDEAEETIARAARLGARVVVGGKDHPDYPAVAAVLVDPFGNEFEVTTFHD